MEARGVITAARDADHRHFIAHRIPWEEPAAWPGRFSYAYAKKLSAIDCGDGRRPVRGV